MTPRDGEGGEGDPVDLTLTVEGERLLAVGTGDCTFEFDLVLRSACLLDGEVVVSDCEDSSDEDDPPTPQRVRFTRAP